MRMSEQIKTKYETFVEMISDSNEGLVRHIYNRIDPRYKIAFFCAIISAVLSHGMALFNKYSFHDDVGSLFTAGATFTSGRWFVHILSWKIIGIFGKLHSAPLWDGGIAILLISLSCILIIWAFDIKDKLICGLLAFFMICFPVVAGMLGFMYFSPYYGTALALATLGSCLLIRNNNIASFLIACICIAFSLGLYQAYLPIYISCLLLGVMMACLKDNVKVKTVILKGISYILAIFGGVGNYFFLNRYMLKRYHQELSDYKGMNNVGRISLDEFPQQLKLCYEMFFDVKSTQLFPKILGSLYIIILLSGGVISLYIFIEIGKKNLIKAMFFLVGLILFPIAVNFHYIMVSLEVGRSTMQCYCYVMVVLWLLLMLDYIQSRKFKFQRVLNIGSVLIVMFFCISFVRLDNANYLKAEMLRTRVIGYYTTLITQIKSVDGYKDGMPITYIKNGAMEDSSIYEMDVWDEFYIHPYCTTEYAITYSWSEYIRYWLGFNPEWVDNADFINLKEVEEMPCYPNDGSIKIINDTIVVKLSDSGVGI